MSSEPKTAATFLLCLVSFRIRCEQYFATHVLYFGVTEFVEVCRSMNEVCKAWKNSTKLPSLPQGVCSVAVLNPAYASPPHISHISVSYSSSSNPNPNPNPVVCPLHPQYTGFFCSSSFPFCSMHYLFSLSALSFSLFLLHSLYVCTSSLALFPLLLLALFLKFS